LEVVGKGNMVVILVPLFFILKVVQDLEKIAHRAVCGKKKGQIGIFYPIQDVELLGQQKGCNIGEDWIPEVRITKYIVEVKLHISFINPM
jgi:hypothetical protein